MAGQPLARLLAALDDTIDAGRLTRVVHELAGTPVRRGRELPLAIRLADWCRRQWPDATWWHEPVGAEGGNLVARSGATDPGAELLLYSHLDTSLTGDPQLDRWATGSAAPLGPLVTTDPTGTTLSGFGLGVARAPAAAALIGFVAAGTALRRAGLPHRLTLLLASAGTHASPFDADGPPGPPRTGVEAYLDAHPAPAAAVVAKSGPAGILYAEPGALFLRVQFSGPLRPVLAREAQVPAGGILAHLGPVLEILERWRRDHLAARADPRRPCGPEVGIGAVRAGLPGKPDLLPGLVELHLYVVTVPGDDPDDIRATVRDRLTDGLRGGPLASCPLRVDAHLVHPAGSTPPDAAVVTHARAGWA
ncbi:hypothetical protein, partial [Micromonospora echinofusca]